MRCITSLRSLRSITSVSPPPGTIGTPASMRRSAPIMTLLTIPPSEMPLWK